MKITLIRKDEEQGTEALSLCDTDAFFEKVKTENKAGHISELREILPRLAGSSAATSTSTNCRVSILP